MKKLIAIAAAAVICAALSGCASAPVDRNYVINSTGYGDMAAGEKAARDEALDAARMNLLDNLQIFMENQLVLSDKTVRNIMFATTVAGEGKKSSNVYQVSLRYEFDLFRFAVDNLSFREIRTWKLLGLDNCYSDYVKSNYPLGIWLKNNQNAGKKHDPVTLSLLSALPLYSGFFNLSKPVEGGFFVLGKTVGLATAVFHPQTGAKLWAAGGLVVMTVLDIMAVYNGSDTINQRLNALEASVTDSGAEFRAPAVQKTF